MVVTLNEKDPVTLCGVIRKQDITKRFQGILKFLTGLQKNLQGSLYKKRSCNDDV